MKIQNISGSILVVTIADIATRLEVLGTATFPDTEAANADFLKLVTTGKIRVVNSGSAVGAKAAATTAVAVGAYTLTLNASTGTGKISPGDKFIISGDTTVYTVTSGVDDDISNSSAATITFYPALVIAIPSTTTPPSITLVSSVAPIETRAADFYVGTITGSTGVFATGNTVTVQGVTFEFTTNATTALTAATNTRIRLDLYAATQIAQAEALRDAINASTVLQALGVVAAPLITLAAKSGAASGNNTCITVTSPRDLPLTLIDVADNITTSVAAANGNANQLGLQHYSSRRLEMFKIKSNHTAQSIYTGFTSIDAVMVQITRAGVNSLHKGAVTWFGGWVNIAVGPDTTGTTSAVVSSALAPDDIITVLVSGY